MKDLLLLDYETTGFSVARGAEGVQLAAIRLDGETLVEIASFSTHIRPETPHLASPQALAVHNLSLETLAKAPGSRAVLGSFEQALFAPPELRRPGDACLLVAHNAGFDRRFHHLLLERAGAPQNRHGEDIFCSIKYFKKITSRWALPIGGGGMNIDALGADAGLPERGTHDALEDVRMVADVLRYAYSRIPRGDHGRARTLWADCRVETKTQKR